MKKAAQKFNIISVLVAVTAVLSLLMIVRGVSMRTVIAANNDVADRISQDIEYEKQRIEEINSMMEKAGTDEYIEKVARSQGMIKNDEIVFIDISEEE